MNLLFRVNATHDTGLGHFKRCLALAQTCAADGGTVHFMMETNLQGLQSELELNRLNYIQTDRLAGSNDDALAVTTVAKDFDVDFVMVDGYKFGFDFQSVLRSANQRFLVFDDHQNDNCFASDVILNPNAGASSFSYPNRLPSTKLLLDSQFSLIRREFLRASRTRKTPEAVNRVLVILGGTDPGELTLNVASTLAATSRRLEIKIVIGFGALSFRKQLKKMSLSHHSFEIVEHVSDLGPLMSWAESAVTAGGATLSELLFMGVPSAVITTDGNQEPGVSYLSKQNCIEYLGRQDELAVNQWQTSLQKMFESPIRRATLAEKGSKMIDGLGSERVLRELQSML